MTPRTDRPGRSAHVRGGPLGNEARGVGAAFSQTTLDTTRHDAHPFCLLCGAENARGLSLDFRVMPDGAVQALFAGSERHEGYPDTLHGGLVAALLDAAMTNCLFARGIVAVTARLSVRYLRPGRLGTPLEIVATLDRSSRSLHYLSAEVRQNGGVVAAAMATFKERTDGLGSAADQADPTPEGVRT